MDPNDVVIEAREFYNSVKDLPYPEGFSVSPWWQKNRERMTEDIAEFKTSLEAIHAGQTDVYGFDHRRANTKLVDIKLQRLRQLFGHLPYIRESEFSRPNTVYYGYSNVFLYHFYFYLRSTRYCPGVKNVLEIGSGYGSLARIFRILRPEVEYTLLDLPESLFFACNFLKMNMPGDEFNFVPVQKIEDLYGKEFDLVINTGSLQEMPASTVNFFINFIQEKIKPDILYSCNYTAGERINMPEAGNNNPLPIDDSKWDVLFREINPEFIKIDSDRDWLETALKRRVNSE